ncbi:MAG TPA: hypothetical protein ENK57_23865 [Polyangiaceae bacterium]|nr:hypothetical protein [Polyangiaceae bacterium]
MSARLPLDEGIVLPAPRTFDPNPLGLPPVAPVPMKKGQRVFAAPPRMVRAAKLGTSFMLAMATFLAMEGNDYVVRVGFGEPYQVHPGYVVVPRPGRFRRGAIVIAGYRDQLHHGVVTGLRRDRVMVQYTDLGFRLGDQRLAHDRIGVLSGGLEPGAYAAYRADQEYRHVQLVSSGRHPDGKTVWLAIEHEGQIRLIDEAQLVSLPRPRFNPRPGSTVLAAWRGAMVRATVRELERPGLYTVKRPRAGAPLLVGPDMIMPVT